MADPWYKSGTNQAALIGGGFLLLSTLVGGFFATRRSGPYPPFEIRSYEGGSEMVLSHLALTPSEQLLDSAGFAGLNPTELIVNDSLGAAIAKPVSYEWTVGDVGVMDKVSEEDIPFLGFLKEQIRSGWPRDTTRDRIPAFGVRLDHPVRIELSRQSLLDSAVLGYNPFSDSKYAMGWLRANYGAIVSSFPPDTIADAVERLSRQMDSIMSARLPRTREVYSGVFVTRVRRADLPYHPLVSWLKRDLLDEAVSSASVAVGSPSLLIVDRAHGTAVLNETIALSNVVVDGRPTGRLYVNRVGYALVAGDSVFLVILQYVSNQDRAVLTELERFFRSVRLRRSKA